MYQELSKREKISILSLTLWVLIASTLLIVFNILLVRLKLNSDLTDFMIIILCVVITYSYIKKNLIFYKYCIIEDELIIHEMIGSKEKRVLNLNVHQIVSFEKTNSDTYLKDKQGTYASKKRLYNCENVPNRHYIVFDDACEQKWFTFQPSDHMIQLINDRIEKE